MYRGFSSTLYVGMPWMSFSDDDPRRSPGAGAVPVPVAVVAVVAVAVAVVAVVEVVL